MGNSTIRVHMPNQKGPSNRTSRDSRQKFSHANLESRREALLRRLDNLSPKLRANRGYASARALLGASYLRASLRARLAVLQTAQFMITVLEMLPPT